MANHNHVTQARSASAANVLLGCWLIATLWVFGDAFSRSAFWNNIVAGALVALLAASRFSRPRRLSSSNLLVLLLGLWTIASPWIYGYAGKAAAMWNCIATGIAIAALATWSDRAAAAERRRDAPPMTAAR